MGPAEYDCLRIVIVRDGSAVVFSEFGQQPVAMGDLILLGPGVLCGFEPEGQVTVTTVYVDTDLAVDQFFWQYSTILHDRLEAQGLAERVYSEPAQVLHLGRDRAGMLMPWVDEMVAISAACLYHEKFHHLLARWFDLLDVFVPFVRITRVRLTALQGARSRLIMPRYRNFDPLRREAVLTRDALHTAIDHPWTLAELSARVNLSPRQLARLFTQAFGKTPSAYLVMLRVEEMARLLRETDMTVKSVGRRVGWRSRSRAVEAFSELTGVSPSRYRDMRPTGADLP